MQKYFQDASEAYLSGDFNTAIILLKNTLQKSPNNAAARLMLGKTYLHIGSPVFAEKELRAAQKYGASKEQIYLPLARAYLLQGKSEEVINKLEDIETAPPLFRSQLAVLKGDAYLELGQVADAKSAYKKAIQFIPVADEAEVGLAQVALFEEDLDTARVHIDRALKIAPYSARAWTVAGKLEYRLKNYARSKEAFARALRSSPAYVPALLGESLLLIGLKELDRANKSLEKVLNIYPMHPIANYLSAVVAFEKKDLRAAEFFLIKVEQTAPDHMPTLYLKGAVFYASRQYEQSVKVLNRFVLAKSDHMPAQKLLAAGYLHLQSPDRAIKVLQPFADSTRDPQLLLMLGNALIQKGDLSAATLYLERATALAPDVAAIRTQLAITLMGSGESSRSIQMLSTAVELDQSGGEADVLLVMSLLKKEDFDAALKVAKELADKRKESPIPLNLVGNAYLGKGDKEMARQAFLQALKVDVNYDTARLNLARLDMSSGYFSKARKQYETILKHDQNNVGAMMGMADVEIKSNKARQAQKWLEKAHKESPNALLPGVTLVDFYLRSGKHEQAVTVAEKLIQRHPESPTAFQSLGRAQLASKQFAAAIKTFVRLVDLSSDSPDALVMLATAERMAGDTTAAIRHINQALKQDERNLPALISLAEAGIESNQLSLASSAVNRINEFYPELAVGDELAGKIAIRRKDYSRAARHFQTGYEKQPSSALAVKLYQSHKQNGNRKLMLDSLLHWLKLHPEDNRTRMLLASTYTEEGQYKLASDQYEYLQNKQPGNVVIMNNLAWVYFKQNDKRALELAEKANRLLPGQPGIQDTLGWILVHSSKAERGLTILKAAAAAAPREGGIQYHLAVAYQQLGQSGKARETLRKLLNDNPEFGSVNEAKILLEKLGN